MTDTEEGLEAAIDAVVKGVSIKKASQIFDLPYSKLYYSVRPDVNQYCIAPRAGAYLYPKEEDYLENYILKCAEQGLPRTAADISKAAHSIMSAFPRPTRLEGYPGRHFVYNFIKRRPNLSFRSVSHLPAAGAKVSNESMDAWFEWFDVYLKNHGLTDFYNNHPGNVFNCDESPLPANPKPKQAVGSKQSRRRYQLAKPNSKQMFTMLATANAEGKLLRPYIILKGKRVSDALKSSVPDNVDYTLEKEGYETHATFKGNDF